MFTAHIYIHICNIPTYMECILFVHIVVDMYLVRKVHIHLYLYIHTHVYKYVCVYNVRLAKNTHRKYNKHICLTYIHTHIYRLCLSKIQVYIVYIQLHHLHPYVNLYIHICMCIYVCIYMYAYTQS